MQVGIRQTQFASLVADAAACSRCPALCERRAVLSDLNGKPSARVMFIAEAPGRQGGDRTGVPLSGDQSGKNFARYLATTGLTRRRIFITNAVLCNPRRASGANRTPTQTEVVNCSAFLRRQLDVINPAVVVTLGRVALDALRRIQYHPLTLQIDAGQVHEWNGRALVPLYHPSPQVLASHRREHQQLADYAAVARAASANEKHTTQSRHRTRQHRTRRQPSRMTDSITLYVLAHCSTCQRTAQALKDSGARFEQRDIRKHPLSRTEVSNLARLAGGASELFSRRALAYRERGLHERTLDEEEMIDLMTEQDTFIRRPLLLAGERVIPGCTVRGLDKILQEQSHK